MIDKQYINVVKYKPLSGSSYVELASELKHHRKGPMNIMNNDSACFRRCHLARKFPVEKDA